jgi:hypothetical protein
MPKPHLSREPTTLNELVKVAFARDQAEADFLQRLLNEADVRSLVRRAPGFDVPDFLAAGPRDVLVAAKDVPTARQVLLPDDPVAEGRPSKLRESPSAFACSVGDRSAACRVPRLRRWRRAAVTAWLRVIGR